MLSPSELVNRGLDKAAILLVAARGLVCDAIAECPEG